MSWRENGFVYTILGSPGQPLANRLDMAVIALVQGVPPGAAREICYQQSAQYLPFVP